MEGNHENNSTDTANVGEGCISRRRRHRGSTTPRGSNGGWSGDTRDAFGDHDKPAGSHNGLGDREFRPRRLLRHQCYGDHERWHGLSGDGRHCRWSIGVWNDVNEEQPNGY